MSDRNIRRGWAIPIFGIASVIALLGFGSVPAFIVCAAAAVLAMFVPE